MSAESGTSRRPKVLVVTASVGAGHNSAARAIVESLRRANCDLDVDLIDVLPLTPWIFRAYYAGGYATMVSNCPAAYGFGYALTNRPHRPGRSIEERRRLLVERWAMQKVTRTLLERSPDLVVHTHFLAPPLVGRLIGRGMMSTRQMVVITDNDAHRFWYAENVERWFVANSHCVELLERWGIDRDHITASGLPIHPKWTAPLDRAKILDEWLLPSGDDSKIVLLSGGTEFTCAPVARIACQIVDACPNAYVLVLCGNNKKLLGRVGKVSITRPRVRAVSFTDRLHELVEVCSLVVTKAGGITTAECLARAAPMVILKPVPGQEAYNAGYFERNSAAVVVRRWRDVVGEVSRLLADGEALAKLSENSRRLYRPASETIVEAALQALSR